MRKLFLMKFCAIVQLKSGNSWNIIYQIFPYFWHTKIKKMKTIIANGYSISFNENGYDALNKLILNKKGRVLFI